MTGFYRWRDGKNPVGGENTLDATVVFWDIGDTIGSPRISSSPRRLVGLDVFPYVQPILEQLQRENIRLGIISNTGPNDTIESIKEVLENAGIYNLFEPDLLIYSTDPTVGMRKDSPIIFRLAAEKAGHMLNPENCLYIGEDRQERVYAKDAKLKVASHPLLIEDVLNGRELRYIRIAAPENRDETWRKKLRDHPVVPLYVTGDQGITVYAIASAQTALILDDLGFYIDRLGAGGLPQTTKLYLLRDNLQAGTGFSDTQGQSFSSFSEDNETSQLILSSTEEGLFVALPAGFSVENLHFATAHHGHNLKLMPDMSLLFPVDTVPNIQPATFLGFDGAEPSLSDDELAILAEITPTVLQSFIERYTGVKPLDNAGKINSRHIFSPDNLRATQSLASDLENIDKNELHVDIHQFVHEGRTLDNIEAELRGKTDELVLITAHLDSTATSSPGDYDPKDDPAPGADDDASGIAAVLAAAQAIKKLSALKKPKRSIRFVLFNAEEHGLVGSKAYARKQAMLDAPIVAVYQMDMIGYNKLPPRSWEVHAGFSASSEVENRSALLAERIKALQDKVSPNLEIPQIYTNPDPAAGRSDHASFQERGYAACAVSEDFFAGPLPTSPEAEPNPNYHQKSDVLDNVDVDYAADIARVVAAAAWVTANI